MKAIVVSALSAVEAEQSVLPSTTRVSAIDSLMKTALLIAIRLYKRFLSPALLPACRYTPTCSDYAAEAVELHGAAKGAMLAACRLLRCHPFSRGGFDPVPSAHCASRFHHKEVASGLPPEALKP